MRLVVCFYIPRSEGDVIRFEFARCRAFWDPGEARIVKDARVGDANAILVDFGLLGVPRESGPWLVVPSTR